MPRARRDMRRIDAASSARIVRAVLRLAATGQGDVKRLQGAAEPEHRLRVGDWRVRLLLDHAAGRIVVLRVLPRGQAYR
ncbi:MAG: type II toxin-antitoxin system RelE/ParE family toxin [Deltaproteobacteria bacterium]|nr:type II toxin-antitoxin system RelE/ParE family toxin [Deltaproteobacteria bacterium]